MTERKLLFLDFDGVINVDVPKATWPDAATAKVSENVGSGLRLLHPLSWSPAMLAELTDVVNSTGAHVVWVTTWCENQIIREAERKLKWNPGAAVARYVHIPGDTDGAEYTEWKLHAVVKALEPGDTAVWVDDHAVLDHGAAAASAAAELGAVLHAVAPDSTAGLTPADLNQIRALLGS